MSSNGRSLADKARIRTAQIDANVTEVSEESVPNEAEAYAKQPEKKAEKVQSTIDPTGGIKAEIKVNAWNLFVFLLYHNYISVMGIFGTLLSLFCLGYFSYEVTGAAASQVVNSGGRDLLMLFVGLWYPLINPVLLLVKAFRQANAGAFKTPIIYTFCEDGILQEQGQNRGEATWNRITKPVFLRSTWLLYTGRQYATIIPPAQLGSDRDAVKALIERKTGKK